MSEDKTTHIGREIAKMPVEPLLPIEKKLMVWSLALGAVLLFVLLRAGNTWFPAGK